MRDQGRARKRGKRKKWKRERKKRNIRVAA
jgi:hypothetical protein